MAGFPWDGEPSETIDLQVFGMACSHCRDTVETVLEDHAAVRSADVDLEDGTAEVEGEPGLAADELAERLRGVGYEARETT